MDSEKASNESEPLIEIGKANPESRNELLKSRCWVFFSTIFPILQWLPKYKLKWLQYDAIAGLTVGLTVLPQGLAYAQIADLPLQYGLYTAFMGGFVYCILGTSKDVTLGPTAIMSLFVHRYGDGDIVKVVLLTLLGGCVQFVMGVFRLGFIMRYLSVPVISGFTSAAAITIGFGQVKHILGIKIESDSFIPEVIATFKNIPNSNIWDVVVGLCCIVLLLLMKFANSAMKKHPTDSKCQSVSKTFIWFISTARNAIIVLSAAGIAYAIHSQHVSSCKVPDCITLTGKIDSGLPPFKAPAVTEVKGNVTITTGQLVKSLGEGLVIVPLMGFLESIAIGKAFARKDGYNLDVNQEMIAIGVANILSSFVSSYTITGSFSRTAINNQSNVKTPAGGIFTGLLVIIGLCVLTPLFYFIPKSALAAVIISAVAFMVDVQTVKKLWLTKKIDLLPLVITFFVCFWEIQYGILAGVAASLLILLFPISFPSVSFSTFPSHDHSRKENIVVSIKSGLDYPSAEYIYDKVKSKVLLEQNSLDAVIVDFQHISNMDFTTAQAVSELAVDINKLNLHFKIASAEERIRTILLNIIKVGTVNFCKDIDEALNPI